MQEVNHYITGDSETASSYLSAAPKSCKMGLGLGNILSRSRVHMA